MLKLMKNDHFLVFLAVSVIFPKYYGRSRSGLYHNLREMISVLRVIAFPIVLILHHEKDWQREVFKFVKNDHVLVFFFV